MFESIVLTLGQVGIARKPLWEITIESSIYPDHLPTTAFYSPLSLSQHHGHPTLRIRERQVAVCHTQERCVLDPYH